MIFRRKLLLRADAMPQEEKSSQSAKAEEGNERGLGYGIDFDPTKRKSVNRE